MINTRLQSASGRRTDRSQSKSQITFKSKQDKNCDTMVKLPVENNIIVQTEPTIDLVKLHVEEQPDNLVGDSE